MSFLGFPLSCENEMQSKILEIKYKYALTGLIETKQMINNFLYINYAS